MKLLEGPLRGLTPLCLLLAAVAGAGAQTDDDGSAPSLIQKVAQAYAADLRGAIGMQRHFSTAIKAGPVAHSETSDSGILFSDGAFVKIKYYRIVDDSKAFSAAQIQARESQTNKDWTAGKIFFKEPYDQRYIGDYRFSQPQACSDCPSGLLAVSFTSALKDVQHGDGIMWIDPTDARVTQLVYTPNALPPHATKGTVTEVSSNPAPGIWYVTRIDEVYQGREFIIKGTGKFSGTFDQIRRFPNLAEAQAALDAGTI